MLNSEDITFISTLVACVIAAPFYRRLSNVAARHMLGTGLGVLVIVLVCGNHAHHSMLMVITDLAIINMCNRLYIHDICLAFSWSYLVYLFWQVRMSSYALVINQVLALRLVGLASDLQTSDRIKSETVDGLLVCGSKFNIEADVLPREPDAMDMAHYTLNFIGIHKGPYYRWKTFNDYFTLDFSSLGNCRVITERKLKKLAIFAVVYAWLQFNYPVEVYETADFFVIHSADYRLLYNAPQLIRYMLASQMTSLVTAAVCSEAGFILYPTIANPQPGSGATADLDLLDAAPSNPMEATALDYNLRTIKTYDNKALLLGPTMRQTLRGWDMSVQYWFWAHVYRKIEHNSRLVKSTIVFIMWSLWCGMTKNQLILAPTLWLYIHLEDECGELCRKYILNEDSGQLVWSVSFSVVRALCLVYITPCLILKKRLLRYYNSVFWAFHVALVMLATGVFVAKPQPAVHRSEPSRMDVSQANAAADAAADADIIDGRK